MFGSCIGKTFNARVYRFLWNENVTLYECKYAEAYRPNTIINEIGEITFKTFKPVSDLIIGGSYSVSYSPTPKKYVILIYTQCTFCCSLFNFQHCHSFCLTQYSCVLLENCIFVVQ